MLSDGAASYTPGISQRRGGVTTYDLTDHLDTSIRQTNAAAATMGTRTYSALGGFVASTGTPIGPFGFAGGSGYQQDLDSGLYLLGHRYYDPSTGRFLSRDSAQAGRNWYVYCDNNPNTYVDADGQQTGPKGQKPKKKPVPYKPEQIIIVKPGRPYPNVEGNYTVVPYNGGYLLVPKGWPMYDSSDGGLISIGPPGSKPPKVKRPKTKKTSGTRV